MVSVSEQVSQEIHQGLKDMDLTVLSGENTASLIGQLQNIAKKENCVHNIIGKSPIVVLRRGVKNVEDEEVDLTLEASYWTI